MEKEKFDHLVMIFVKSISIDLFEYGDALWDLFSRENHRESINYPLVENVLMDRLIKIYSTFLRENGLLAEAYQIINAEDSVQ